MDDEEFNLFVPLEEKSFKKSSNGKEDTYLIRGYASTPNKDRDGDIILPGNLNIQDFISRGFINYEHKQGDAYRIGVPTENTYIDPEHGLFVEAKLFMDNPYAQDMWNLSKSLAKSGSGRKVGFSIEGKLLGRDYRNPAIIKNVKVKNVAITTNPANPEATWETFTKSFTTGDDVVGAGISDEGAAALRRQSIAHSISELCYNIKDVTDKEWVEIAKTMDKEGRYDKDVMALFLQLSKGLSRNDAKETLNRL